MPPPLALTLCTAPKPFSVREAGPEFDPARQITSRTAEEPWPVTMSHIDRIPGEKDDGSSGLW
ncbi:hypothetical protein OG285_25145 [Streptomyces sp. NBC_01471]|uniref:hypothetical protein n=1 Tax=Streptomyces sp. NBC_01471 TaxID=2903879 RepID=UPI00324ADFC4